MMKKCNNFKLFGLPVYVKEEHNLIDEVTLFCSIGL